MLEAICYLAGGKSFRAVGDTDLIKFQHDFFRIRANFVYHDTSYLFEAALDSKGRKFIKIDERKIERISELYKYLKVVYFSQEDIELIDGQPKKRRQFFDLAAAQKDYSYINKYRDYQKILKQRNALLKTQYSVKDKQIWDARFVEAAAEVTIPRIEYLQTINQEITAKYSEIGYQNEKIEITYRFSYDVSDKLPLKDTIRAELKKKEREERLYQRTMVGPHIDDYLFFVNGLPLSRFGSHGQKRCFSIAARLAQAVILNRKEHDTAIMIFDDVLADLDEKRAGAIIESLSSSNQIFIATPNPLPYKVLNLPFINVEECV